MGLNACRRFLEDARHLAAKGDVETRTSCMRRAVSTASYAVFHLLVEDSRAIKLAEGAFARWRSIRDEDVARHHLLSMFGANR